MLDSKGDLKVTDFGIARSLTDSASMLTMAHGTSGTLLYMSPQQLNGERASHLDDIYSVGATIYELLTGKPPFYSGAVDRQIRERPAPALSARRGELEIAGATAVPTPWSRRSLPVSQGSRTAAAECRRNCPASRADGAAHSFCARGEGREKPSLPLQSPIPKQPQPAAVPQVAPVPPAAVCRTNRKQEDSPGGCARHCSDHCAWRLVVRNRATTPRGRAQATSGNSDGTTRNDTESAETESAGRRAIEERARMDAEAQKERLNAAEKERLQMAEATANGAQFRSPSTASKEQPWENSLEMKFVPVRRITGGATAGRQVMFATFETQVRSFKQFVEETARTCRRVMPPLPWKLDGTGRPHLEASGWRLAESALSGASGPDGKSPCCLRQLGRCRRVLRMADRAGAQEWPTASGLDV
jgi:serine/threonine protein kinase